MDYLGLIYGGGTLLTLLSSGAGFLIGLQAACTRGQDQSDHPEFTADDALTYDAKTLLTSGTKFAAVLYQEVLKKANEEKELSFTAVEDALCSTNHAVIGGLLAQSWWLPDDICMAIRHHHDYSQLDHGSQPGLSPASNGLIATVLLAEHLFQHHTKLSQTQEWLKGETVCLRLLGLTEKDLTQLYPRKSI